LDGQFEDGPVAGIVMTVKRLNGSVDVPILVSVVRDLNYSWNSVGAIISEGKRLHAVSLRMLATRFVTICTDVPGDRSRLVILRMF
jgi:hypothetical protein